MTDFARDLLIWYDAQHIVLPWRGAPDPYHIWLSEIMLQQTQIATMTPYYERFLVRFPTVEALAAAPLDDVLKLWEGLGYYSRARNLHRAAQHITAAGGHFPTNAANLQQLPGIGRYTAGAIASIAFGERVAVLDGNVIRVLSRVFDVADDVTKPATQRNLWQMAEGLVPTERPGDYNQAIMDLGRLICTPRTPDCAHCPVASYCAAFHAGSQAARPVKAPKAAAPHYDMAAGVIWNATGQLLIAQRPANGLLGGLWGFPGGKLEVGETLTDCLKRTLRETLAIDVEVDELLTRVKHAFTHFQITVYAYECRYLAGGSAGEPQAINDAAWQWVMPDELDQFAFARTDRYVIDAIRAKSGRLL